MNWNDFLANKSATRHSTSKQEIEDLRAVVLRNLSDAAAEGISVDGTFSHAYDAILVLAKIAVACSGYRIKGTGAHRNTLLAMSLACGPEAHPLCQYE